METKEPCPVRILRTKRMQWNALVFRQSDLQYLFNELEKALEFAQSDKMGLKVEVHLVEREDV